MGLFVADRIAIGGVGGHEDTMPVYVVELAVRSLPPRTLRVVAHAGEPWVLLGRDVLNHHRVLLDGPNLVLELG